MATSRCLSLVPANLIKKCFFSTVPVKSHSLLYRSTLCRFKYQISSFSLAKLNYATDSSKSPSSAKNLAEEILKSKLQVEGTTSSTTSSSSGPTGEEESEEDKKKREAAWKTMKYTFIAFGVTFGALGVWLLVECGAPKTDPDGKDIEDEFSELPIVQQYLYRSWNELKVYNKMIREPSREKLLPDPVKEPYYQPPYTLVLEMTDVLVHPDWTYQTGWRFKKRPNVDTFLQQVGPPLFEVVIYTSEQGFTAFPILDALDPNGYIMYRLFRDATRYQEGHHIKDLDCLNRDLKKVIIVDWNQNAVKKNWRNALQLQRWKGNDDDSTLLDLAMFLRTIATSEVDDVREVLDFYHQYDDPLQAFKDNLQKLQEKESETKKVEPITKTTWSPSFIKPRT